jgi:hypothetical protein
MPARQPIQAEPTATTGEGRNRERAERAADGIRLPTDRRGERIDDRAVVDSVPHDVADVSKETIGTRKATKSSGRTSTKPRDAVGGAKLRAKIPNNPGIDARNKSITMRRRHQKLPNGEGGDEDALRNGIISTSLLKRASRLSSGAVIDSTANPPDVAASTTSIMRSDARSVATRKRVPSTIST